MNNTLYNDFISHVLTFYEIPIDEFFTTKTKKNEVVRIKQLIQFVLKRKARLPLKKIGKLVNLDHSTVFYSVKLVDTDLQYAPHTREIDLRIVTEIYNMYELRSVEARENNKEIIKNNLVGVINE